MEGMQEHCIPYLIPAYIKSHETEKGLNSSEKDCLLDILSTAGLIDLDVEPHLCCP